MRVSDEPLEKFYPVCCVCGEQITGDGYEMPDGEYYCEECMADNRIDGTKIAEEDRQSAYEMTMEILNG